MEEKMVFAYLFEARSIQGYLFAGGKLRDMMVSSDMLDWLCLDVLDRALENLEMADDSKPSNNKTSVRFPRRAGGAFYAVFDDEQQAKRLRNLWSFTVARFLPGLEALHVIAKGTTDADAVSNGQAKLLAARNTPTVALPEAGPLVARCQRTGLPAVMEDKGEAIDASLRRRREKNENDPNSQRRRLGEKFLEMSKNGCHGPKLVFPCDFERDNRNENDPNVFPFDGEDRTVAIIHADGNGLGLILRQLSDAIKDKPDTYTKAFRGFSDALGNATQAAAQKATAAVLAPKAKQYKQYAKDNCRTLPARPLVLGGDDLTIIVRADLALAFVQKFIEAFEDCSEAELGTWKKNLNELGLASDKLPGYLTACAGVVFVHANQPFSQAYELAESLCQRAKKASDQVIGNLPMKPSSLAFARITTSSFEDAEDLYRQELEVDGKNVRLTLGTYGIGRHANTLPTLKNLEAFLSILGKKEVSRGPARKLMTVLQQDIQEAKRLWSRWLEVLNERKAESGLLDAIAMLGKYDKENKGLPFVEIPILGWAIPFGDAHDLAAIGHIPLFEISQGGVA